MDEIKSLILERALTQYKASGSTKDPDVKALGAWLKDKVWESRMLAGDNAVEQVYLANLKRVNYVSKSYEIMPSFINDLRNKIQKHAGDSDWKVTATTTSKRSTKVTKVTATEVEPDYSDSIEEDVSPISTYMATSETTSSPTVVNRYQPRTKSSNIVQATSEPESSDYEYDDEEVESEEGMDLDAIQTVFTSATERLNNRSNNQSNTRTRTRQQSTSRESILDRVRQNNATRSSARRKTSTTARTSGLSTLSTTSSNRTTSTSRSTTSSSKLPSGILGNRANTKKNLNRR